MYDILTLSEKLLPELRQIAKDLNIRRVESYKKQELIYKILDEQALKPVEAVPVANASGCGADSRSGDHSPSALRGKTYDALPGEKPVKRSRQGV